jgi:hypothetical protein
MVVWKMKGGLELRFFGAETNLIDRSPTADEQGNSINEEGFARPCLSRKHGKSGENTETQLLKDGKIDDAQLSEHGCEVGSD